MSFTIAIAKLRRHLELCWRCAAGRRCQIAQDLRRKIERERVLERLPRKMLEVK
jgi:hypothetical protein